MNLKINQTMKFEGDETSFEQNLLLKGKTGQTIGPKLQKPNEIE